MFEFKEDWAAKLVQWINKSTESKYEQNIPINVEQIKKRSDCRTVFNFFLFQSIPGSCYTEI